VSSSRRAPKGNRALSWPAAGAELALSWQGTHLMFLVSSSRRRASSKVSFTPLHRSKAGVLGVDCGRGQCSQGVGGQQQRQPASRAHQPSCNPAIATPLNPPQPASQPATHCSMVYSISTWWPCRCAPTHPLLTNHTTGSTDGAAAGPPLTAAWCIQSARGGRAAAPPWPWGRAPP
jgi:hypothetical protein